MENIEITKEWDKVFPKSDNVDHEIWNHFGCRFIQTKRF